MSTDERLKLMRAAGDSALILDRQLILLLDAYDFYVNRYPATTDTELLELQDLQVSIKELSTLPTQVAAHLRAWQADEDPQISALGFELNVLNEFALHMHAVATFMFRKEIDIEPLDPTLIGKAFLELRVANRLLAQQKV